MNQKLVFLMILSAFFTPQVILSSDMAYKQAASSDSLFRSIDRPELNRQLFKAVKCGAIHVAADILAEGADPNTSDDDLHMSVLEVAIYDGYFDMVKMLVEHGADVNFLHDDQTTTPLAFAIRHSARFSNSKIIKYLISHGANIVMALSHIDKESLGYQKFLSAMVELSIDDATI